MRGPRVSIPVLGVLAATAALSLAPPARAGADDPAGSVKTVSGAATVVRGAQRLEARPGLRLLAGDTLVTAEGASLGVVLRDDSLISLGPSTDVALEQFLFAPAHAEYGLTTRLLRGTMAYLSGIIGRLAPDSVRLVTPVATIGVRGTHVALRVAK